MYFVDLVGVTQLHNIVYVVCRSSSAISRFDARTHRRLTDINVKDMSNPVDIAACKRTSQLYVADRLNVWRLSSGGADIQRLLPKSASNPLERLRALSVTATGLLVTTSGQLMQFDTDGDVSRRVSVSNPTHAVESPTGILIVSQCHDNLVYDEDLQQQIYGKRQVSIVNTGGQLVREFSGSDKLPLVSIPHVAVHSKGNIFVADRDNRRILLLDAQLKLRRVIIDEHQLNHEQPVRLCYTEQSGQLLVGLAGRASVAVFHVLIDGQNA